MQKFDFMSAKLAHGRWRVRLRLFLDDMQTLSLSEATSPRDCDLGKWLYSDGLTTWGSLPDMQQLERVHDDMHARVRRIIEAKNAGKLDEAEKGYDEMEGVSDNVVRLLDAIERQTAQ